MKRISITPRPDWQKKVEEQGFTFYKFDSYYSETACYEFTAEEIDKLDIATAQIFDMCLKAVDAIISGIAGITLSDFGIPQEMHKLIAWSWNMDMPSLYGRFDLAYNPDTGVIKVLEFNADTPTSLLEASVIQYYWLQEYNDKADQFNSIHEKLLAHFQVIRPYLYGDNKLYFACIKDNVEDFMTTKYLQDVADQAGLETDFLYMEDISMDKNETGYFTKSGVPISNIFKLYPYEWLFNEPFGKFMPRLKETTMWIEPPYKAIMSNKRFMEVLYKLFPENQYLLQTYYSKEPLSKESFSLFNYLQYTEPQDKWVQKPILSREGANVTIFNSQGDIIEQTGGEYGSEGYVMQEYVELPVFDGKIPILGSWLIAGETAGMGIRESESRITGNTANFVPHFFLNK